MAFPFLFSSWSFSTIKWQTGVVYAITWRRGNVFSSKYRAWNICLYLCINWFRLNPKPTFTEVWFRPVTVIDDGEKEQTDIFEGRQVEVITYKLDRKTLLLCWTIQVCHFCKSKVIEHWQFPVVQPNIILTLVIYEDWAHKKRNTWSELEGGPLLKPSIAGP